MSINFKQLREDQRHYRQAEERWIRDRLETFHDLVTLYRVSESDVSWYAAIGRNTQGGPVPCLYKAENTTGLGVTLLPRSMFPCYPHAAPDVAPEIVAGPMTVMVAAEYAAVLAMGMGWGQAEITGTWWDGAR